MFQPSRRRVVQGALLLVSVLAAAGRASAGEPSNDEQLMLELTNRMRWDPAAELHILVNINKGPPATWRAPKSNDPNVASALGYFNVDANTLATQWAGLATRVAPLAWNGALHNAAVAHNAEMIRYDQQSHQLPGEPTLGQRLVSAGYAYTAGAENVYAYSDSVFYGHAGFAVDWGPAPGGIQNPPGHRNTIMNGNLREVGISITPENNPATAVGPLVITQDFGRRNGNPFLTGVVYDDAGAAPDHFYTPGEGLGGVTVQALTSGTSAVRGSTTTFASGGYTLQLAAGKYDVTLSGGALGSRTVTYRDVQVGSSNVKVDNLSSFTAAPGGTWNAVQNWSAGVPNGPGTTAVLGRAIPGQPAGPRTVTVSAPITVGRLVFDDDNPATVGGTAVVGISGGGAPGSMHVRQAPGGTSHTITAPVSFAGEVVRDGPGTLTIAGAQNHATGASLSVRQGRTDITSNAGAPGSRRLAIAADGAATRLSFLQSQDLKRLDVTGGARVAFTPNGSSVLVTEGLLLDGGTVDLADNAMIVDYDGAADPARAAVPDAIRRAYAGGTSAGTGITSSTAASRRNGAVGFAESSDVFQFRPDVVRTFFGRVVDETAMLVRYTLEGDADLDGAVTFSDFRRLREGLASAGEWSDGDFDYDCRVTARDYALLRMNFGASVGGAAARVTAAEWADLDAFAATVPEPAGAALLLLGTGAVLRRRPRTKRDEL